LQLALLITAGIVAVVAVAVAALMRQAASRPQR
jgi:hypothetical protein